MSIFFENLIVTAKLNESIDLVVRRIASYSKKVAYPGLAIILDKDNIVLGVVSDSDIRRAYASDTPFSLGIGEIMVEKPITILSNTPDDQITSEVIRKIQSDSRHESLWVRYILIVDVENKLINVVDFLDAMQKTNSSVTSVSVFGLGYVGLTLSVSLANRGHQVAGIDIDKGLIKQLNEGNSHVYEPGLAHMLSFNLIRKKIKFYNQLTQEKSRVYIVAVGTPLDENSKPGLKALNDVLETISAFLKYGDHIMLRSTVPVGTTRNIVVPHLESSSGLKAGKDFFVSFAPERTIEGNAMDELKMLPQVVGGYSAMCLKKSVEFWSTLTSTVVRMDSLEAAELVKLANNTFRDVSFAFANELAMLADSFNVNAFSLINNANEGYPRNKISLPSPGVGGYCLTKDPILFSSTFSSGMRKDAVMGVSSRIVNARATKYPVELLKKYILKEGLELHKINVLIMGVAFKGVPETKDTRGSISLDILKILTDKVHKVFGWDAVINEHDLAKFGFSTEKFLKDAVHKSDVILILNNHPKNIQTEIFNSPVQKRLIFDGWNQLDMIEVEKIKGVKYSTMGYITK